ncbi:MAG: nucleoside/nucleotide kinase family protein [Selenomonadaceae bacterium]|nr:nucleoside/nucleotide kinase family protein [Selenomonadaceae bacterium]
MAKKEWTSYTWEVNGLQQQAQYNKTTVEGLFMPLLRRLTFLYEEKKERVILFMAAPPATGKSTLTLFLEKLSREREGLIPMQALGLDGFHHHAAYLSAHTFRRDGKSLPLSTIKGAPETFDAAKLAAKLKAVKDAKEDDIYWPVYDRSIHDVREEAVPVTEKILLLEGNWLLLKEEPWASLRSYGDYALLIRANASLLRERLIARKVQGGMSPEAAEKFYLASDSRNVERVLKDSGSPNEIWEMLTDNDYVQVAE